MMYTKERIIRAIGPEAYAVGKQLGDRPCPYDDEYTIRERMEELGKCFHCFVPQCPLNTLEVNGEGNSTV